MAAMSDYLENKSLDHCLGTTTFTKPTVTYVALYTAAPSDTGGGTEVLTGGTGYTRQLATWTPAVAGQAGNAIQVQFGPAVTNWGTITHFAVFDASAGGNMLYHDGLTASKAIAIGDLGLFLVGDLKISHA